MQGAETAARYQSGADQTSAEEKTYQAAKYGEIIEILLSAGYFRARISGLSEFDKVGHHVAPRACEKPKVPGALAP
jgi:hypothetical protein